MTMTATSAARNASAPIVRNGVNVTDLFNTIEAIKGDAAIAKFNFRLKNSWIDGDRNQSTIKTFSGALATHREDKPGFVFENGEHQVLLGQDRAPNPVEWLLHALIGCMTTTTAYHAASRNIAIEAIDSRPSRGLPAASCIRPFVRYRIGGTPMICVKRQAGRIRDFSKRWASQAMKKAPWRARPPLISPETRWTRCGAGPSTGASAGFSLGLLAIRGIQ